MNCQYDKEVNQKSYLDKKKKEKISHVIYI